MNSEIGRKFFMTFLESDGSDALLRFLKQKLILNNDKKILTIRFWIDVNKLKTFSRMTEEQFSFAHRIYENFITRFDSPVRDELNAQLCNNMKLFLIGSSVSFI